MIFLCMHINGLSEMDCFQDVSFCLMFELNGLFLKSGLFLRVSHFSKVGRLVQNRLTFEKRLSLKSKPILTV